MPAYGQDVDESVILPETGLEHLVSYTKGCYIGQEVVARVKYRGHVNRALTGLRLEGERVPAPGAIVAAAEREIGRVTSAAWSLGLGRAHRARLRAARAPRAGRGRVRQDRGRPGPRARVGSSVRLVPSVTPRSVP